MSHPPIPDPLRDRLARLDQKRAAFAGLSVPVVESLYGSLRVELTYASNALEGNTLSLRETQLIVGEGLVPGPGKTLAVVGLGNLGRTAAAVGRQLGLRVVGVRRSGGKTAGVGRVYRPAQITTALRKADFIVVAAPLTAQTRDLLSSEVLASTKPGVGIINMGRAGIIDYAALTALLANGHVSGAILDVFSPEPLPANSALWSKTWSKLWINSRCRKRKRMSC